MRLSRQGDSSTTKAEATTRTSQQEVNFYIVTTNNILYLTSAAHAGTEKLMNTQHAIGNTSTHMNYLYLTLSLPMLLSNTIIISTQRTDILLNQDKYVVDQKSFSDRSLLNEV